ncbi:CapA family protein [Gorillibacterium sp. sgz500922]|uniref:CapA family protein n=1 Tax=Gorillibacterium sp. sgz500922 TaxID=3446694 RepID=UPI003F67F5DB
MGTNRGKLAAPALALLVLLTGAGCTNSSTEQTASPITTPQAASPSPTELAAVTPTPTEEPSVPETQTRVSITAVGDVLVHSSVWKDAKQADGHFDFRPMFKHVKQQMADSDITFANSESIIGGESLGLSSYPVFNSPFEVGDALKEAGVDIVSMANNHSMDFREKAILQATAHWSKLGILYAGVNRSEDERDQIRILERNGVKVAFLAYTYGTNGIPIPAGKEYLVNLLDKERLAADIRRAKSEADAVVVSMHWGIEYSTTPNEDQKAWAQLAADEGATLVLGHHPHVLQPVEWVTGKEGNRTLVFYSLGNFLAAQEQSDPHRQIGGIAKLDLVVRKSAAGTEAVAENPTFRPTYIQFRNWRGYEIVPLKEAPLDLLPDRSRYIKDIAELMQRFAPDLKITG